MTQHKLDTYMLGIAHLTALQSKAQRLKVGAVFSRDGRPLCTGWNGMLEGIADDSCETLHYCDCYMPEFDNGILTCPSCSGTGMIWKTKPSVIHAEMNALRYMARAGISTNGATLYITHAPCINCAKHLAGIGLTRLVYTTLYRSSEGLDFLRNNTTISIEQKDFSWTHVVPATSLCHQVTTWALSAALA